MSLSMPSRFISLVKCPQENNRINSLSFVTIIPYKHNGYYM